MTRAATARPLPRAAMVAVLLVAAAGSARAEEGLLVARALAGASTTGDDQRPRGTVLGSADLCLSELTGVLAEVSWTNLAGDASTVGLGLGVKRLLLQRDYHRLYVHLEPELLLSWSGGERRVDAALRAGAGWDWLFMWGLGLTVELGGTVNAGRGQLQAGELVSAGLTAGLFTEF